MKSAEKEKPQMRKPNDLTDEIKVLPVAVIHSAGETKPMLEALRDGGITSARGQ